MCKFEMACLFEYVPRVVEFGVSGIECLDVLLGVRINGSEMGCWTYLEMGYIEGITHWS